jgi:pyruvate/2-oxoglutarate dehydrogenase complex dihydrolipoamide dehydrogenase (E3) component
MNETGRAQVRVEPFDEHNRRLVDNVHPPDWRNPEPEDRYHLVVIGAGAGGLVSAVGSAGLGARVAIVERHLLGGDCLNVGCVPSKGVIRAARAWHDARAAVAFGAPRLGGGGGDFAAAMERMRRLRAQISPIDSAARLTSAGVDVFLGHGRFSGRDAVDVEGATLRFRRAVIATGARAAAPPIPGLAQVGYRTNETIFELTELPPRLAVIGAGPIGCELAQAFARFGSRVTLFDVVPRVLIREDVDAAAIVASALARDGVELALGVEMVEVRGVVTPGGAGVGEVAGAARARGAGERTVVWERDGERRETICDEILVAAGRAPNVEDLGLDAAGVAHDKTGVLVDDRLRTTNPRIFAVGDITPLPKFTHLADAHAAMVIQNAFFFGRARHQSLVVPWVTYTAPEIAHVGRYEKEARDAGLATQSITVPLHENDRAVLDGAEEGFLRVVVEKGKDRILGATLVAEHAGDMIGEICLAITHGIGLGKIASTIHPYPTQSEVFRKAANQWRRGRLTPTVKRIFDLRFRTLR